MGSAAAVEAGVGGLYMNTLELSPMRTTLEELDHRQLATPMRTDNSTVDGIMNKTIKQKQGKQWTRDCIGYRIELNKENSEYSRHLENTM